MFVRTCVFAGAGTLFAGLVWAQAPTKSYLECNHDSLVSVLRAYEDSLALARSTAAVRVDYAWRVTDVSVADKVYKIYRCEALYDSLTVLMNAVNLARATSPVVDTDSVSGVMGTSAVLHARVTSDGGSAVTATGFKYGTDALLTSPMDAAGSGTTSPFTGALTGLANCTQYWAVGYATNGVGTSYGDTISFTTTPPPCAIPSVTFDGHTYVTVQIGTQCWFAENLRNDSYSNGDSIPGNLDDVQWQGASGGAQAVYGEGTTTVSAGSSDEVANLATYGRLYNGHAVSDPRGVCPSGWHIPSNPEWSTLAAHIGGQTVAATALKATAPGWDGLNSNCFAALPGGWRHPLHSEFQRAGSYGYWWDSQGSAWHMVTGSGSINRAGMDPEYGASIRCIQD